MLNNYKTKDDITGADYRPIGQRKIWMMLLT